MLLLQRPGCSNVSWKWAILRRLEGLVVEGVVARWLQKQPPGPRPRVGGGGEGWQIGGGGHSPHLPLYTTSMSPQLSTLRHRNKSRHKRAEHLSEQTFASLARNVPKQILSRKLQNPGNTSQIKKGTGCASTALKSMNLDCSDKTLHVLSCHESLANWRNFN